MSGKINIPFKKILCPTDLSEPSYVGVTAATKIAENQSAELILVHVVTPIYHGGAMGVPASFNSKKYYDEMREIASKNMEDHMKKNQISENVTARTIITDGAAPDKIIETAEKESVDLIVMATHGWTGWRRFVFGSVTEKVVRISSRPLLIIPEPKAYGN